MGQALLIPFALCAVAVTAEEDGLDLSLRKAYAFLESGEHDSAMAYSAKGFEFPEKRDSVLFLFSEVFLRKGATDTALAFNVQIPDENAGLSKYEILTQREHIYSRLGWREKASEVRKGIRKTRRYRLGLVVPSLGILLGGGVRYGESYPALDYKNQPPPTGDREDDNGWFSTDRLRLRWTIPLTGPSLDFDLGIGIRKPYYQEAQLDSPDSSAVLNLPLRLGVDDLGGRISVGVNASPEWSRFSEPTLAAGGHLEIAHIGALGKHKGALRYLGNLVTGSYSRYQQFNLSYSFGRPTARGNRLEFLIDTEAYLSKKWEFDLVPAADMPVKIAYAEDVQAPFVTYFRDSGFSEESRVDTAGKTGFQYLTDLEKAFTATQLYSIIPSPTAELPAGYLAVAPRIGYSFDVANFRFLPGISYKLHYYMEKYEWTEFNYDVVSDTLSLVYDKETQSYHKRTTDFVGASPMNGSVRDVHTEIEEDAVYRKREKQRIDHTLQAGLDVYWIHERLGSISLSLGGVRTYSSIDNLPYQTIDDWWWTAGLSWFKTFDWIK